MQKRIKNGAMTALLLALSILPVILLMIFIYRADKYEREPIKTLTKAFIGGMLAIPLDILLVTLINQVVYSNTVFHQAFLNAGFPEELSKFIIFMIFIWRDKNFNEYMDGIVYATFIGLGFACVENVMYVFNASAESFQTGVATSVVRALLSVPGHFLFGVLMGYFLSMAKFKKGKTLPYLLIALLTAAAGHGLFDWLLMVSDALGPGIGTVIYLAFLWGDIKLWKIGIKYIRQQQENSRLQAENDDFGDGPDIGLPNLNYDPEYKQIDWNAGDRQ